MLCLDHFATGHLGISSGHHVNFELALFDLDRRLGYLCNLEAVTLNDILFFSTQPQVWNWGHFFLVLSCVCWIQLLKSSSTRGLQKYSCQQHLMTFHLRPSYDHKWKKKKKSLSLMRQYQGAIRSGKETKRCAHICTAFEGTWRHLESLFFSTTSLFFLKLASQEGELWAFISEWKACGWHPEQRGLSARPRQTSVPGLYSKILEQGEGLWWK